MDIGTLVGESFAYAKEGLVGKWMKWILLLIATILLTLPLMGYTLRVYRGANPSPEVDDWGTLFVDGIKYLIVGLIYAIPLIIIGVISIMPLISAAVSGDTSQAMAAVGTFLIGLVVFIIVAIIIGLFANIGVVRFARTGSMGEAFNFSAILETIGKIGWLNYILALVVMGIIIGIVEMICNFIPYVGIVILFIIIPFISLFQARYICMLYDSAGSA
jgi:hypothetical protein